MAFINKDSFKIYDNCQIGYDNIRDCDSFFEVDDLIAPIISKLNIRGYTTVSCCQGHPYLEYDCDIFGSHEPFPTDYEILGRFPLTSNQTFVMYQHNNLNRMRSYIMFDYGIKLPNCPTGWVETKTPMDSRVVLEMKYSSQSTPMSFFKSLTGEMFKLNDWVEKLPICVESSNQKWNYVVGCILRKVPNLRSVEIEIVRDGFVKGKDINSIISDLVTFYN